MKADQIGTTLIGTGGTITTAALESWHLPSLATVTGTLTAIWLGLQIVGWFLDRRAKRRTAPAFKPFPPRDP